MKAKFFSALPGLKVTGLTGLQLYVGFIWLYREGMIIVKELLQVCLMEFSSPECLLPNYQVAVSQITDSETYYKL